MVESLKENNQDHIEIYADLQGHNVNGSTIPQNIIVTSSRPDLVILDKNNRTLYLCELTVCFEAKDNIERAHSRKYERYSGLSEDIKSLGYECKNWPFDVGSRGHLTIDNGTTLALIHSVCKPATKFKTFKDNITKTSLLCSYSIYLSREDPWSEIPHLIPTIKK